MERKKTYIVCFFLFLGIALVLTRRLFRWVEAFQSVSATADVELSEEELALEDELRRQEAVRKIIYPGALDIFKVELPRPFAEWGYRTYSATEPDPLAIRKNLITNFQEQMKLFVTRSTEEVAKDAAWNTNIKAKSCEQLTALTAAYEAALQSLKPTVATYNAKVQAAIDQKDINRSRQTDPRVLPHCLNSQDDNCLALANLDIGVTGESGEISPDGGYMLQNLRSFEQVNTEVLLREDQIKENIRVLNQIAPLMGCNKVFTQPSGTPPLDQKEIRKVIGLETGGVLKSDILKLKLKETSPYALSPDVVKFIIDTLINSTPIEEQELTLKEIRDNIKASKARIKTRNGV